MKYLNKGIGILFLISVVCLGGSVFNLYLNQDSIAPVISCETDVIEAEINTDESILLEGVTATDNEDGDLTSEIFMEGIEKTEDGASNEFVVTYVVFDKSGNRDSATRTLIYTDYEATQFVFTSELKFAEGSNIDVLSYVQAIDCIDGEITNFVKLIDMDGLSNTSPSGVYQCQLEVENSVGDTAVLPVNVEVYEGTYEKQAFEPIIYLSQYILYLEVGEKFDALDYVAYVDDVTMKQIDYKPLTSEGITPALLDESLPGDWINYTEITYDGAVDTDVPGVYEAGYVYTSDSTNYSTKTKMIVVVTE